MRELDAVSWMSGGGRHRSCIEVPPEVECYDVHRMTSLLGCAEVGPLYCSCNLSCSITSRVATGRDSEVRSGHLGN